jgi:Ser/Thr protein kinase RdoA (MazF antagonist)
MPLDRLSTYLNDHYAASVAAVELSRRSAGANRGTALGKALERLTAEIEEDRASLRTIMDGLGVGTDPTKSTGAWLAEKLGRLKLNGSLISYSPLSRLEELEVLALGVEGKLRLWRTLERQTDRELEETDLRALITRARSQLERLEQYRLDAVDEAF